jgi:hypothetical protein
MENAGTGAGAAEAPEVMMAASPLTTWFDRGGKLLRLCLSRPKANIVDAEMIATIDDAIEKHGNNADLLAILIDQDAEFQFRRQRRGTFARSMRRHAWRHEQPGY